MSQGRWSFLNNETQVKVVNSSGTFIQNIQAIVADRYEWLDSLGNYGVMAPKRQAGAAVDTIALLTGATWTYREFVGLANSDSSRLWYRKGRGSNNFHMESYTLKVNANGTFTEVNQDGLTITGSWQKSVYKWQTCLMIGSTGLPVMLTYVIQKLDAAHLEFLDYTNKQFSALVPQ